MELGVLFNRAVYRELRSAIGYYDARRITRILKENAGKANSLQDLGKLLKKMDIDDRQIQMTMDVVNRYAHLLRQKQDLSTIDGLMFTSLTAPVTVIAEKSRGITWLKKKARPLKNK